MSRRSLVVTVLVTLALSMTPHGGAMAAQRVDPAANDDAGEYEMYDYVTCAVYFRMIVGSMSARNGSDLGTLVEIEREKMNKAMALGRASANEEYGAAMADEMFDSQWRDVLADMTDQINRNYQNIHRLKYRYEDRCETIVKDPPG